MHTIERRLVILAGMLFAVQNADSGPVTVPVPVPSAKEMTVSDLMVSNTLSKKFGLVDYFKELKLDQQCKKPILNINEFNMFENDNNIVPCLCTVIYNMTQELNTILENVSETVKTNFNSSQLKSDLAVFEVWKNVSTKSSSLNLFMEPLKDEEKWKNVCHSIKNNVLTRYCKFLNFEVMMWHNVMSKPNKPAIEKIVENVPKNLEPVIPSVDSVIPVEPSVPSGIGIDAGADDPSKVIDFNNIDEEPAVESNKEDETTIEDIQDKPIDTKDELSSTKLKDDSKSNNDYPNLEDGTLIDSGPKEAQSRFIQKNTFTNHDFGDVEDSHFLFYFGVMTVFSLLFYLALYNKKKIIALLIEGRRSTNHRRRPNTASYSKVETDDGTTVF